MTRHCSLCGDLMDGLRRDAVYCSGGCRAEASRLRRLAAGKPVDGYSSLADRLSVAQKRTQRRVTRYIEGVK